jgi:hypothetical protein
MAMRIRRITLPYHIFPHYLINGTTLKKIVIESKTCVSIFSTTLPETLLILKRI